jgi:hypothetical protein
MYLLLRYGLAVSSFSAIPVDGNMTQVFENALPNIYEDYTRTKLVFYFERVYIHKL